MPDRKRSAISGKFVTTEYADAHPDTTVSERRAPRPETPDVPELRRLAEAATPGPWAWDDDHARPGLRHGRSFGGILFRCGALYGPAAADAEFIAAASPDVVLGLLAAAAERDRLAGLLDETRRSGCAVEIAGVRIAPCDERGRTADMRALDAARAERYAAFAALATPATASPIDP